MAAMGDGDGWVWCQQGHRHWGRFGAAGLLLVDQGRVVLQHRAERTHEGNTWGLPGGARDSDEDPVQTALREADEEADIHQDGVDPIGTFRSDHGGWSYTTVIAAARGEVRPRAANWESNEVRWWDVAEVGDLALHPGLRASWPALRHQPPPMTIIADMANIVGSRPDGWWHDRRGATARLSRRLTGLTRTGIAAADLPEPPSMGALDRVLPRLVLVVEGAAAAPQGAALDPGPDAGTEAGTEAGTDPQPEDDARAEPWWRSRTTIVCAPGSGDDQIVIEARRATGTALVVSADRGLRARVADTAQVAGPQWLYGLLG